MIDDELQVLGTPHDNKKLNKLVIAIIAILAIAIGTVFYIFISFTQPEIIKSGKRMGDSTIVKELQGTVVKMLNDELTKIDGLQGQVIVMEVQTGEILAMVGLERNFEGAYQPCNNFAYQQEPGSTMQTVSLLAALETDKVNLFDVVQTGTGVYPVDNEREMVDHNWRRGGYGTITLDRALEVSSNIGIGIAVNKAFGNNQQGFFDQLEKMSFGQPEHINGIEGLKPNKYSSPKDSNWIKRRIWWSAVGYERLMTPIQMLTFYNAIANDGKMVKPTLKTGEIEIINPQIAFKDNIKRMQTVLDHVVSQGLGKKAGTDIIRVAGKTGTAQIKEYDYGEGVYVSEYHLVFCGYFPAEKPKYSMIVSMNKLGLPASGGGMAGALFHNIMEWMITHDMPSLAVIDEETNDTIQVSEKTINKVHEILEKQEENNH